MKPLNQFIGIILSTSSLGYCDGSNSDSLPVPKDRRSNHYPPQIQYPYLNNANLQSRIILNQNLAMQQGRPYQVPQLSYEMPYDANLRIYEPLDYTYPGQYEYDPGTSYP